MRKNYLGQKSDLKVNKMLMLLKLSGWDKWGTLSVVEEFARGIALNSKLEEIRNAHEQEGEWVTFWSWDGATKKIKGYDSEAQKRIDYDFVVLKKIGSETSESYEHFREFEKLTGLYLGQYN